MPKGGLMPFITGTGASLQIGKETVVESNIIRTCELRNKQTRVFVRINRDAIFQE